jgi:hypothetical protein
MGGSAGTLQGAAGTSGALKERGNTCFAAADFPGAELAYTEGINQDPANAVLYSNRSATSFQLGSFGQAVADAKTAIALRPRWNKAYYRAAVALAAIRQQLVREANAAADGDEGPRLVCVAMALEASDMFRKCLAMLPIGTKNTQVEEGFAEEERFLDEACRKDEALRRATVGNVACSLPTSSSSSSSPSAPPPPGRVSALANHSGLYTWGLGEHGALGHGSLQAEEAPQAVKALRGKEIADVGCGLAHTVIVTRSGETWACGLNSQSQLGMGHHHGEDASLGATGDAVNAAYIGKVVCLPQLVPSLLGIQARGVACGAGHVVLCTEDRRVFTWGLGSQGQLGHGDYCGRAEPAQICFKSISYRGNGGAGGDQTLVAVVAVAAGIAHSTILDVSGTA